MFNFKKLIRGLIYITGILMLISLFLSLYFNNMVLFTIMTCLFTIFLIIFIILMIIEINNEENIIKYVNKNLYQCLSDFKSINGFKSKLFNGSFSIMYFLLIPMLVIGIIFIVLLSFQMIINII